MHVLEDRQARHQPRRQRRWPRPVRIDRAELLLKKPPVDRRRQPGQLGGLCRRSGRAGSSTNRPDRCPDAPLAASQIAPIASPKKRVTPPAQLANPAKTNTSKSPQTPKKSWCLKVRHELLAASTGRGRRGRASGQCTPPAMRPERASSRSPSGVRTLRPSATSDFALFVCQNCCHCSPCQYPRPGCSRQV